MSHCWEKDDEIIAIDAYFRIQDGEDKKAAIKRAVKYVKCRTVRDEEPPFNKHRSMEMKMRNLAHLQNPNAPGTLGNVAKKTIRVWNQYVRNGICDKDGLAREMERIIKSFS